MHVVGDGGKEARHYKFAPATKKIYDDDENLFFQIKYLKTNPDTGAIDT